MSGVRWRIFGAVSVVLVAACSTGAPSNPPAITAEEFSRLQIGMTSAEVERIVGGGGVVRSEAGFGRHTMVGRQYEGDESGAVALLLFRDDALMSKVQQGL